MIKSETTMYYTFKNEWICKKFGRNLLHVFFDKNNELLEDYDKIGVKVSNSIKKDLIVNQYLMKYI